MRLRTRFAVAALFVLGTVAAAGWWLPGTVRDAQMEELDRQLAASVPAGALVAVPRVGLDGPPRPVEDALSDIYVALLQGERRALVVESQAAPDSEPAVPDTSSTFEDVIPTTVGSNTGSGRWRAVLFDGPDAEQLLVAIPLGRVDATVQRARNTVLGAGAAIVAVTAIAGWWLFRLGLRPIAEVTEVAQAIASGDRSRRVRSTGTGTEASALAQAFNVMLDEQHATETRLRQFVADASHELRTPVAAIAGFADLWRQDALQDADLDDVMRRIGQESARMRGLVEDLLLLARLDEGRPALREPVDLTVLAGDARLDASATHPSRAVTVDAPPTAFVRGDENQLRQVFANLVSNALSHAGAEAAVMIRVELGSTVATVTVADDGVGMSEQDAAHAVDRFWRADTARASTGMGLGLAIVKSVADAHGGTVAIRSFRGAGTEVQVELPI